MAYQTIEWTDLIPQNDLDALLNPPDYLAEVLDGSLEDQVDSQLRNSSIQVEGAPKDRYQQALTSTEVKQEFDQRMVRIPGFVVPIEFNDDNDVISFFLVPFFGACTHLPAPPPNQIIYSEYRTGEKVDDLNDAVWITGVLSTSSITNELATSAYSIVVDSISPYQ